MLHVSPAQGLAGSNKNIENCWTDVKFKRPLSVNLLCLPFLFEKLSQFELIAPSIEDGESCSVSWEKDTIATKLADIILENSEAIFAELCRGISELLTFFCKNEVFDRYTLPKYLHIFTILYLK